MAVSGTPSHPAIRVFDTLDGHVAASFAPDHFALRSLVLNRDGTRAAAGGDAYDIAGAHAFVWNVSSGQEIKPLTEDQLKVEPSMSVILNRVALSGDGTRLATITGYSEETLRIWNLADNRLLAEPRLAGRRNSRTGAFARNGGRIVLLNLDKGWRLSIRGGRLPCGGQILGLKPVSHDG